MDWLGSADIDEEVREEDADARTTDEGSPLGAVVLDARSALSGSNVRILSRRQDEVTPQMMWEDPKVNPPLPSPSHYSAAAADNIPQLMKPPRANALDGKCCVGLDDWLAAADSSNFPSWGALEAENDEEQEWSDRQRTTGAASRMVIYDPGEEPRDDLLLRGGGRARRVMVTAVTHGGKAFMFGVKAGDVLVSINGKKDFLGKTADEVHRSLSAPVTLVFVGFVGKLHAEVRLNCQEEPFGLSSREQVVLGCPESPVQVLDEVVFKPTAQLMLAAPSPREYRSAARQRVSPPVANIGVPGAHYSHVDQGAMPVECTGVGSAGLEPIPSAMYELGVQDARQLLLGAMSPGRAGLRGDSRTFSRSLSPPPMPAIGRAPFPSGPSVLSLPKGPCFSPPTPGLPDGNPFNV